MKLLNISPIAQNHLPLRVVQLLVLFLVSGCQQSAPESNQKASVGYNDTVLFNAHSIYSFEDYQGPKPFYVSIWFPAPRERSDNMVLNDLLSTKGNLMTRSLDSTIISMSLRSIHDFGILNKLNSWEDRPEDSISLSILQKIKSISLESVRSSKFPNRKYPAIIYHHGMGGSKEENYLLFESLAKMGFVVFASNFHWPDQSSDIGEAARDAEFIIDKVKDLPFTDETDITYVGHSWGSQIGLLVNQRKSDSVTRFILLDTTLEQLTYRMVRQYYPWLDSLTERYPDDFKIPTDIITSRKGYYENGIFEENDPPGFEIYRHINTDSMRFHVGTFFLDHEAFTTTGVIRNLIPSKNQLGDSLLLNDQYLNYIKVNKLIISLLSSRDSNSTHFRLENVE